VLRVVDHPLGHRTVDRPFNLFGIIPMISERPGRLTPGTNLSVYVELATKICAQKLIKRISPRTASPPRGVVVGSLM
jgi:hypothetical protein